MVPPLPSERVKKTVYFQSFRELRGLAESILAVELAAAQLLSLYSVQLTSETHGHQCCSSGIIAIYSCMTPHRGKVVLHFWHSHVAFPCKPWLRDTNYSLNSSVRGSDTEWHARLSRMPLSDRGGQKSLP